MSSYENNEHNEYDNDTDNEQDNQQCPICDRIDKSDDFMNCNYCNTMICESCYDHEHDLCEYCAIKEDDKKE